MKLTVIADDAIITPDKKGTITAKNNQIKSTDAKALADIEALVETMKATATYDGKEITPTVTADFAAIKAGTVGIYKVEFSIDGDGNASTVNDNISKSVKLTVIADGAIITPDKKGSITAKNNQIKSTDAKALANIDALVTTMGDSATYDGAKITPTVTADFAAIEAGTVGIYDVKFSIDGDGNNSTVNDNISTTVKLTVTADDAIITPDGKGTLSAENKQIKSTDAKALANKDALVEVMNATATYDGEVKVPLVRASAFNIINDGVIGYYDVTFSIIEGKAAHTSVKLKVVSDEVIVKPEIDDTGVLSSLGIYTSIIVIAGCTYALRIRRQS